jgi:hypothetical protein
MPVRTVIERGPKARKAVAFALDWPGWSRGARSPEEALETLEAYRERYRPVAVGAGMAEAFDAAGPLEVVEDRVGSGSTDFWGISFTPCALEPEPMDHHELERKLRLVRAAWVFFDGVAARVSPEMRKGPRGGGRDRDRIIRHTIRTESEDFARKVELRIPAEGALGAALPGYRDAYLEAIRAYQRGDIKGRMFTFNLPFLVRHTAFHTLDHAWEMEDKDLTGETGG